jgi:hypothetical protein
MTPSRNPWLLLIGACLLSVLALVGSFNARRELSDEQRAYRDPYRVNVQSQRFGQAGELLPARGVVGYVSDMEFTSTAGLAAFLTAQYTLAPRALVAAASAQRPEWVVGNFAHPQDYAATGSPLGLQVVRDFGEGVVVYRRAAR